MWPGLSGLTGRIYRKLTHYLQTCDTSWYCEHRNRHELHWAWRQHTSAKFFCIGNFPKKRENKWLIPHSPWLALLSGRTPVLSLRTLGSAQNAMNAVATGKNAQPHATLSTHQNSCCASSSERRKLPPVLVKWQSDEGFRTTHISTATLLCKIYMHARHVLQESSSIWPDGCILALMSGVFWWLKFNRYDKSVVTFCRIKDSVTTTNTQCSYVIQTNFDIYGFMNLSNSPMSACHSHQVQFFILRVQVMAEDPLRTQN